MRRTTEDKLCDILTALLPAEASARFADLQAREQAALEAERKAQGAAERAERAILDAERRTKAAELQEANGAALAKKAKADMALLKEAQDAFHAECHEGIERREAAVAAALADLEQREKELAMERARHAAYVAGREMALQRSQEEAEQLKATWEEKVARLNAAVAG